MQNFGVPYLRKPQQMFQAAIQYQFLTIKSVQMKNHHAFLCILFAFATLAVSAQAQDKLPLNEPDYTKPRLFSRLPESIPVTAARADEIIHSPAGRISQFSLDEAGKVQVDGEVISAASKYNNTIQSVVIRTSQFEGARLTLSRIVLADGKIKYTGRIISFQHGDLYVLEEKEGQLSFVRKTYYELINE